MVDHSDRPGPCAADQTFQFRQFSFPAQSVAVRQGQQQNCFLCAWAGAACQVLLLSCLDGDVQLAEVAQITALQWVPPFRCLAIGLQQFGLSQTIGAWIGCEAQPAVGDEIESEHSIGACRLKPLPLERTAHQSPAATAAAW